VTTTDIDTFLDRQIAAGYRPTTINRRLSTIRTFFEFMAGDKPECSWPNPVIIRHHRLKTGSSLPRDVSDGDVSKIFAVIFNEQDQAMFGLLVRAELRVGENATLQLDSVGAPAEPEGLARLRFLEGRDHPLDPGLFRVKVPKPEANPLPRYLPEADYRWLETNVLQATKGDADNAYFDRAWFLTLAHTGVRLSELLDLRQGDLNLEKGSQQCEAGSQVMTGWSI
jgi:site-specific recombinase XerD